MAELKGLPPLVKPPVKIERPKLKILGSINVEQGLIQMIKIEIAAMVAIGKMF